MLRAGWTGRIDDHSAPAAPGLYRQDRSDEQDEDHDNEDDPEPHHDSSLHCSRTYVSVRRHGDLSRRGGDRRRSRRGGEVNSSHYAFVIRDEDQ
jgi:hypothetical protein